MDQLRSAVFLDRDGVLNRAIIKNGKPYPPASLAELEILPEAAGALMALRAVGFVLVGITNQPDVARGAQKREVVEAINDALRATLPLHDILVCYHDDGDGCECRKPLPGLLLQAAARYAIHLPSSFVIGDRWRDIEAGRRAGCRSVLIRYGYSQDGLHRPADHDALSLGEAVDWILSQSRGGTS